MLNNAHFSGRSASRSGALGALALIATALVVGLAAAPAAAAPSAASSAAASSSAATGVVTGWSPPAARGYVALGDSFTAGQGAPPYRDDTCKQSRYASYPTIAAVFSLYRLTANKACSGATVAATAAQLVGVAGDTKLVTLTVGGIDAGSNDVLAACALNPDPNVDPCRTALATSAAKLAALGPQLVGLYSTIAATLPNAKVVVLNYPRLFNPGVAPLGDLVNQSSDALNAVIAGAVAATANPRVTLVDVTQEFAGHGIGSKLPYIAFDPANLLASANFHPNALGNGLGYARALANDRVLSR
ncbi:GDSL-like Lipase/Acylhydrolase family protein [Agromyces sp. CF514]|uniref:SGNH/GDSL hydrolase family protein n=1 Tax=Agromyces sp. CF514 TaxID=1881031 RepID=UPI0008E02B3A|nr:SGNH/GDSL hydrolase family protein [Agromyces sp. CF514]SFR88302.1 GDSL-like Lipase/Acylhydrolase family protein [Agromyces sp. CF514]